MKRLLHALVVIAVCFALAPLALAKDHDKWRDHDGDRDRDHQFHHDRDHREHRDHDRDRDWRHDRREWREHHAGNHRPAGWDRGRKGGWHDQDMPPGQAKNYPQQYPPHQRPAVLTGNRTNTQRPAPPTLGGKATNATRTAPVLAHNNEH